MKFILYAIIFLLFFTTYSSRKIKKSTKRIVKEGTINAVTEFIQAKDVSEKYYNYIIELLKNDLEEVKENEDQKKLESYIIKVNYKYNKFKKKSKIIVNKVYHKYNGEKIKKLEEKQVTDKNIIYVPQGFAVVIPIEILTNYNWKLATTGVATCVGIYIRTESNVVLIHLDETDDTVEWRIDDFSKDYSINTGTVKAVRIFTSNVDRTFANTITGYFQKYIGFVNVNTSDKIIINLKEPFTTDYNTIVAFFNDAKEAIGNGNTIGEFLNLPKDAHLVRFKEDKIPFRVDWNLPLAFEEKEIYLKADPMKYH